MNDPAAQNRCLGALVILNPSQIPENGPMGLGIDAPGRLGWATMIDNRAVVYRAFTTAIYDALLRIGIPRRGR